jgi:hypothetical protein
MKGKNVTYLAFYLPWHRRSGRNLRPLATGDSDAGTEGRWRERQFSTTVTTQRSTLVGLTTQDEGDDIALIDVDPLHGAVLHGCCRQGLQLLYGRINIDNENSSMFGLCREVGSTVSVIPQTRLLWKRSPIDIILEFNFLITYKTT